MSWNIVAEHRRLLSLETGTVVKDWGGKIPVALAFANNYHTGMSNLGFQSVYGLFNAHGDVVCERFFLPDRTWQNEYTRTGTPLLSLENQRPLTDFELVAFSLSHENDYPGLLRMLNMGGIPGRRQHRREHDPLIMAGGVAVRTNPEPLAELMDLFLLGDGEIIVPSLLRAWREIRSTPLPKPDRILHLARTAPGAYAPAYYEAALDHEGRLKSFGPTRSDLPARIKVARIDKLPSPALASQILTPGTEFSETRLVEIGRGCSRGCRFCLAGFAYRPPRVAALADILEALGPPATPGERVGLVSPAVADHPRLEELIRILIAQDRQVTVSSLRVESLTPSLVEALALGKMKSAAVAPEAGTERLRRYINKGLSEEQILSGVRLLAEAGVRRLKLYYMLGLPTETMDDLLGLAALTIRIKECLMTSTSGKSLAPEITLSLSSFVPKAGTPFQTEPMASIKELKSKVRIVKTALRGQKGLRIHFDAPKWAYLQTFFSRADRRAASLIEALDELDGDFSAALKKLDFDPDQFVTRPMDQDALLPWDLVDHGLDPDYLIKEKSRADQGRITPPCRPQTCRLCGLCPPPGHGLVE
jgi:radical SAM superfamily enzyme YgiQ (UPF0313 family)